MHSEPKPRPASSSEFPLPASPAANPDFEAILAFAASSSDLERQLASLCAPVVQRLIHTRSQDTQEIERTLDRLLNCAYIPEGLALFKELCRHYWTIDQAATAFYVNAYRKMWDSEDEEATQ